MRLTKNDDVIQALAPDRSDQPFGKAILPRGSWCSGLTPRVSTTMSVRPAGSRIKRFQRVRCDGLGPEPEVADLCKAVPYSFPDIGGVIGHDLADCRGAPGGKRLKHCLMIENRLFPCGLLKIADVSDPPQPTGTASVRFD